MKFKSLIDDKKRARAMEALRKNDLGLILPAANQMAGMQDIPAPGRRDLPPEVQMQLNHQLLDAAIVGDINGVRDSIENGADVNYRDSKGATPLFRAVHKGHKEITELLLQRGADADIAGHDNTTPLMGAAVYDRADIAKLLLDAGANVNIARTNDGMTALLWAAREGHAKVAEILVERGADVNARRTDGKTALQRAREQGHADIVAILKKHGARE